MDDSPIEIHIAPNLDECTRVGLRAVFRTPRAVLMSAGIVLMSVALLLFAFGGSTTSPTDYGIMSTLIACAIVLPAAFFLWLRFGIRRRLRDTISKSIVSDAAFSKDVIEMRSAHSSSKSDWTLVRSARRIPEGVEIDYGQRLLFYSRKYFAEGEFDRFLQLLRDKLGPRAKV